MININRSFNIALDQNSWDRQEFMKRSGMSQSVVSRASLQRHASCTKIEQLAKAFNLTPSQFLALGESK